MTSAEPLQVDPTELEGTGNSWYGMAPELAAAPPSSGAGTWPTMAGVQAVTGAAQGATGDLQSQLGATAGRTQGAGTQYGMTEGMNTGSLKDMASMVTGTIQDIEGTATGLMQSGSQTIAGVFGPVVSGLAAMGSAGSSAASSLISGLVGALKGGGGLGAGGLGGNIPGANIPGPMALGAEPELGGQAPPEHQIEPMSERIGGR